MANLKDKVLFITGASRGIGLATAIRAAQDGAKIAIVSKTTEPHPQLPGTIYSAADAIEKAGGQALPIPTDIRHEDQIIHAVDETVRQFGQIDILINNASAIFFASLLNTEEKRYDLVFDINGRGSFFCAKYCLPHLLKAENPHILNDSPPLDAGENALWGLKEENFVNKVAYLASKMVMSLWTVGMSAELKSKGVAVNSIWPKTPIATAAVRNILPQLIDQCRTPEIMAHASYEILIQPAASCTGHFFIDEEVLRRAGVTDFSQYIPEDAKKVG